MAYDGWMTLGDVEIINSSKTWHAATQAGVPLLCGDSCPDLAYTLNDSSYVESQVFPWSDDALAPDGFLGFIGQGIDGLDSGVSTRVITELAGEGATVGALRRGRRELTVHVLAVALSEEALNYGIAWLNSVVRGSVCGSACLGDVLCFYDLCPDSETGTISADDLHHARLKNIFNVGILEAPTVVSKVRLGEVCGGDEPADAWTAELTFMLVAGSPGIYSDPDLVVTVDSADWVVDTSIAGTCNDPVGCRVDPTCAVPPLPPVVPVPTDPCAEPGAGPFERYMATIPNGLMSDWFEKVPVIVVQNGAFEMRDLSVSFAGNPSGVPCASLGGTTLQWCDFCEILYVPYIPARGSLIVDGRTRSAVVECPAAGTSAVTGLVSVSQAKIYGGYVFGQGSQLFTWPVFECGQTYCVQFRREDYSTASTINLYISERRDAT